MVTVPPQAALAPDRRLPARDVLLDDDAVGDRLSWMIGGEGQVPVSDCALVRVKYRIGESLRVLYRLTVDGAEHLVAARAFPSHSPSHFGASADAFRTACRVLAPAGGLRPVVHDAELNAVWWTFPNDRRLRHVDRLLNPTVDVAALVSTDGAWVTSEVAELAPERSVTLRAMGASGDTLAYVKAYAPRGAAVKATAARYDYVATQLRRSGRPVRAPRCLGWSDGHAALALEAMPGERWDHLGWDRAAGPLHRLGQAIGALHGVDPPPGSRAFGRLAVRRVTHSAGLIGDARPDVARRVTALARHLAGHPPPPAELVLLHGDCHPKNALVTDDEVALIDLDQSGVGPAAADIASALARLRHGVLLVEGDAATASALAGAFLDGYASVRPLPADASLRWHLTAALLAERAMRAVNRVNRPALVRLDDLISAAEETCTSRGWP